MEMVNSQIMSLDLVVFRAQEFKSHKLATVRESEKQKLAIQSRRLANQPFSAGGRNDDTKNTNDHLGYEAYADVLVDVVQTIEESGGANFAVGL